MSGGKNNPEHLFYLAGWRHIKTDKYDYYQKELNNGGIIRQLQIQKDRTVTVNDFDVDLDETVNSLDFGLTEADIKALYFKLRSLGFCKDEKKEKKK